MADFLLFADSSNGIQLQPEYSFKDKTAINKSELRTQDGGLKTYKYSEYAAFDVPVKYISNSDQLQINKWWSDVTSLKFVWQGSEYNVRITNSNRPIDSLVLPYDNLYMGTIELEGF